MMYSDLDIISLLQRIDAGGILSAEEYSALKGRQTLNLCDAPIYSLPESIGLLSNLTYLNLSNTKVCKLPESIGRLTRLETLYLYRTTISSLPESVRNLSRLQVFDLSCTQISSLPDQFDELYKLERLYLSDTKIAVLPETISRLAHLERLDINKTSISNLPEWLGALPSLCHLDLSGLIIPRIPQSLESKGLPFYYEPFFPGSCEGINLFHVSLTKQDINSFPFEELIIHFQRGDVNARSIDECNVFLLGEYGEENKSIFRHFIDSCDCQSRKRSKSTDIASDIEVSDYRTGRGVVHFWTVKDQFFLQTMHRFIVPLGACYVIFVSAYGDEGKKQAYHWLQIVRTIAPNSPILLFLCAEKDHETQTRVFVDDLEKAFPNINEVICFSTDQIKEETIFARFMLAVLEMARGSAPYMRKVSSRLYSAYQAVASKIKNSNYLTSEQYEEIIKEHGVYGRDDEKLLTILNEIGVCFKTHLDDDSTVSGRVRLIEFKWLINGIYSILKEGNALALDGRIKQKAIQQILCNDAPKAINGYSYHRIFSDNKYKKDDCDSILAVAAAIGICYRIDPKTWFFPDCCETDAPEDIASLLSEYPNHVDYLIQYSFSPTSVIHRLIIRSLQMDLSLNSCWGHGMILGWNATHKALVRVAGDNNLSISIYAKTNEPAYMLFSLLRSELHDINRALNLVANEYVLSEADRYPINSLIYAAKGTDIVYGNVSGEAHSASEILGLFYDEWSVKLMTVSDGVITIPILPIEYHRCDPQTIVLRQALYEAYHEQCYYCGNRIQSLSEMQVEHVFPQRYEGTSELESYISYLKQRGFNTEKPDYIENYLPVHGKCNLAKSNYVEPYVLLARHECAARKAPQILRLMDKYRRKKATSDC